MTIVKVCDGCGKPIESDYYKVIKYYTTFQGYYPKTLGEFCINCGPDEEDEEARDQDTKS